MLIGVRLQSDGGPDSRASRLQATPGAGPSPQGDQWQYKDTAGQVQGPFSSTEMEGWFESGYLQPDLMLQTVPEAVYYPLSVLQTLSPAHHAKPFLTSQEMAEEVQQLQHILSRFLTNFSAPHHPIRAV